MSRDDTNADTATVPPAGEADIAASAVVADTRRRAALLKLGKTAAYAVPATVSLMAMTRSARAC